MENGGPLSQELGEKVWIQKYDDAIIYGASSKVYYAYAMGFKNDNSDHLTANSGDRAFLLTFL